MKKLFLFLSLLLLLTCAKEDSQAPNTPPSQITRQNTLTVSAGDGGSVSTTGGTSDARFIRKISPCLEFGLVNKTMHKIDECVSISDLKKLTNIYESILVEYFK